MIVAPPEWQLQPGQRRVSETAATHGARTRGQPCHPELSLPPLLFSTSSSVTLQKHAPSLLCELLASAPLRTTSHRVVHCDGWPPVRTNCCRTKPRACLHAFGPTHFLTTSRTKVVHSLRLLLLDTLLPPLEALAVRGSPYPAVVRYHVHLAFAVLHGGQWKRPPQIRSHDGLRFTFRNVSRYLDGRGN